MTNGTSTNWRPERKVMSAALATLILIVVNVIAPDLDIPVGAEAALVTVVAYLVLNPPS